MSRPTDRFLPVEIKTWAGINYAMAPENIEDNELSFSKNIVYRDDGNIAKRTGFKAYTPQGGDRIHKPIGVSRSPGGLDKLVIAVSKDSDDDWADDDYKLYYTVDGATYTELKTAGNNSLSGHIGRGIFYRDFLFIPTTEQIYKFDNSDLTMAEMDGDATRLGGLELAIVQDRIFIISPDEASQINYTDTGELTSIGNEIEVAPGDEWPCTALLPYKDKLVIFKPHAIWVLFLTGTPANWQLRQFADGIGCFGQESCTIVDDTIYFIGPRGVYRTNLSSLDEISVPIRNIFDSRELPVRNADGIRIVNRDAIGRWNNELLCSINTSDGHYMFDFNLANEKWSEWVPEIDSALLDLFSPPSAFVQVEETDVALARGLWLGTLEQNGKLLRYIDIPEEYASGHAYKDNGSFYDGEFRSKALTLNSKVMLKKLPYLYLEAINTVNTEIHVTHNVDLEDVLPPTILMIADEAEYRTLKIKGPGYFRRYVCIVRVIGADEPFEFNSQTFMIRYKPLQSHRDNG